MTDIVSPLPSAPVQEYYRVLTAGADAFGAGQSLRVLLSDHLDFAGPLAGPLAGHRPDATDGFLHGVAGCISAVRSIAEFFTLTNDTIDTLNLHYDGQDYITKGGQ